MIRSASAFQGESGAAAASSIRPISRSRLTEVGKGNCSSSLGSPPSGIGASLYAIQGPVKTAEPGVGSSSGTGNNATVRRKVSPHRAREQAVFEA